VPDVHRSNEMCFLFLPVSVQCQTVVMHAELVQTIPYWRTTESSSCLNL